MLHKGLANVARCFRITSVKVLSERYSVGHSAVGSHVLGAFEPVQRCSEMGVKIKIRRVRRIQR